MENRGNFPLQDQSRPPLNVASSSRRYACDRCRNHKLRCSRDLMTSTNAPCQRCRKARVKCTLGPSIRVGLTHERLNSGMNGDRNLGVFKRREENSHDGNGNGNVPPVSDSQGDQGDQGDQGESMSESDGHFVATEASYQQPNQSAVRTDSGAYLSQAQDPWLDIISFDQGPGLDFNTAASPSLTCPHTGGAQMPHSLPTYPTTTLPRCHSAENLIEFGQSRLPPADAASREQSFDSYPSQVLDVDRMNPVSPMDALTSGLQTGASSSATDSSLSSSELKDACIQELSDLSASLMKELGLIITCKTATSFLFTPSDKATAGYLFKTLDGSTTDNNAVGRMLYGSERFLEILKRFKQLSFSSSALASSLHLQCLDNLSVSSKPPVDSNNSRGQTPEARGAERWSQLQAILNAANQPLAGTTQELSSPLTGNIRPPLAADLQTADTPSILVILSCYTCLLKIYETVFAVIHHVLECSPSLSSATDLPRTIHDLHINGFFLESHRSLQIKILIQVSKHMLNSIRVALGDMAGNSMFQALRKTLMKEDAFAMSTSDDKTDMKDVNEIIQKVEKMLQ